MLVLPKEIWVEWPWTIWEDEMKEHLLRKIPAKRWSIGEVDFLDYQEGNPYFILGDMYGEEFQLQVVDLDQLIEVLQELKIEVQKANDDPR